MSEREPTNREIMNEVQSLQSYMKKIDERLVPLERWKIAFDAADAAIVKYKQEHEAIERPGAISNKIPIMTEAGINKDFVNIVLKFLGILSLVLTILYFVLQQQFGK